MNRRNHLIIQINQKRTVCSLTLFFIVPFKELVLSIHILMKEKKRKEISTYYTQCVYVCVIRSLLSFLLSIVIIIITLLNMEKGD